MAGSELNEIRLANALRLFEAYKQVIAPGSPDLRGLDRGFAINLGISPSYWAQIKSPQRIKGIGKNLARQFERKFYMPDGWLDQARDDEPITLPVRLPAEYSVRVSTLEEKEFLEAMLQLFREKPQRAAEILAT